MAGSGGVANVRKDTVLAQGVEEESDPQFNDPQLIDHEVVVDILEVRNMPAMLNPFLQVQVSNPSARSDRSQVPILSVARAQLNQQQTLNKANGMPCYKSDVRRKFKVIARQEDMQRGRLLVSVCEGTEQDTKLGDLTETRMGPKTIMFPLAKLRSAGEAKRSTCD